MRRIRRRGRAPLRGGSADGRRLRAVPVVAWVAALGLAPAAAAQPKDAMPGLPAGAPVVVLPVQSARAAPDGAWPAGLASEMEVLETLSAEIAFALEERREAAAWAGPDEVVRRARRNPMLGIDPRRVAYHGLLAKKVEGQLYEPLHGQLRALAALFDSRFVVLPLAVWDVPLEPAGPVAGAEPIAPRHRAVLLLSLIDVRRSDVLWQGEILGDAAPRGSPALLAAVAERVARGLVSP